MSSVFKIALDEVGYTEIPANSNKTKYGQWFGLNGVMWCGIFVSWCYWKAGAQLPKIGFTKGFAGCQTAVAYFIKNKLLVKDPLPGDIVFFDWNGDSRFDHTGIYLSHINNNYFNTVEGNTSEANNSNGGSVMVRKRKYGSSVLFVRPKSI